MKIGFLYAIAAAVTWGLVYNIDQKILLNISPITLLFVNSIVTAIIILPIVFIDRGSIKSVLLSGKGNLVLITLSIILAGIANFFIFSGIKFIGAPSASIIEIMYPFFVVLFGVLFFANEFSIPLVIGGIFIFIGSAIITHFH